MASYLDSKDDAESAARNWMEHNGEKGEFRLEEYVGTALLNRFFLTHTPESQG